MESLEDYIISEAILSLVQTGLHLSKNHFELHLIVSIE